jgi:hypothetical protein
MLTREPARGHGLGSILAAIVQIRIFALSVAQSNSAAIQRHGKSLQIDVDVLWTAFQTDFSDA